MKQKKELIRTSTKNEKLIDIMQFADSFFPTGMYTMSNGLETLFYQNRVRGLKQLQMLIESSIRMQLGVSDCVALGNAVDAANKHDVKAMVEIDQMLYSTKLVKELRDASIRSGVQLLDCVAAFARNNLLRRYKRTIYMRKAYGLYPVALGVASSIFGISKYDAALILLYSSSVIFVGAALRLGIIDHKEGQKIIHSLYVFR